MTYIDLPRLLDAFDHGVQLLHLLHGAPGAGVLPDQHKVLHHCNTPHTHTHTSANSQALISAFARLRTCGWGVKADDEWLPGENLRLVVPIASSFIPIALFDLQRPASGGEDEPDDVNGHIEGKLGLAPVNTCKCRRTAPCSSSVRAAHSPGTRMSPFGGVCRHSTHVW